jgi:hypothetical protein
MFDEPEESPGENEHPESTTQDLLNLSEHLGVKADPEPDREEIAKLAHHLWELRKDDPAQVHFTDRDDWRRAEAILSGDAGMGQLEEHDPAASD